MPFIPFHEVFPDLAAQETRTITTLASAYLPAGSYTLIEMYCDEPHCDCRRVFFSVLSSNTLQIETVIAYGWESPAFYAQWMGDDDPETIRGLKGPILNFGSPHSALAPALLDLVKTAVLQDDHYIARLKTHYTIFRQTIDAKRKGRMSQRRSTRPRQSRSTLQDRTRNRNEVPTGSYSQ